MFNYQFSIICDSPLHSFDMNYAIVFPIAVLTNSYYNFKFDTAEFQTRIDNLDGGEFDVIARLFADPAEVANFKAGFDSLRAFQVLKVFLNLFSNMMFASRAAEILTFLKTKSENQMKRTEKQVHPPKSVALILVFAAGAIAAYTGIAVTNAQNNCSVYPECVQYSYQAVIKDDECPCVAYIDRKTVVTSFYEWEHPKDTSPTLKKLAAPGYLRIIQVINRQLKTFPDELAACTNIHQM